jgi:hypothetical protein
MMESVGFKKGLIRFASENNIAKGEKVRYTGRMKMYTLLLILLLGLLTTLIFSLKDVKATVMRTPGMLFQEVGKDSVSNLYNIKVANKTMRSIPLTVKLEDAAGSVTVIGSVIKVEKEGQGAGEFFVTLPTKNITSRKTVVKLGLYEGTKKIADLKTNFLGPVYVNE